MEHRLITGGEQFLPFARSRVKALLALGMPYADQSFEIDGVSIKVRIQPGHEYIRIEGGNTLEMDSGVVDLGNIGYDNPARYLSGQLYGSDYYKAYTVGFTAVSGDWKTNPEGTHQIVGKLKYSPGFKGAIHQDGFSAVSFLPRVVDGAPDAADEALFSKKLLTTACPASMFTGKCRLYVQAMYGRPLHTGGIQNGLTLGSGSGERPYLKINVFEPDNTATISITTDSGVYLDKETGNHWLVNLSNSAGTAYPLKATANVEKLRKNLAEFYAGTSALSADDTEHLEAYILSDCKPVHAGRQDFSFTETKPVWSLGYGWHWNWSGTKANFVYTEAFSQGSGMAASRSTHFQLDVSFNSGMFSAVSSIARGPNDWTLVPSNWCVLEPDWAGGGASKLTQPVTSLMVCSADFYVYYNRDELVVCSVDITTVSDAGDNFEDMSTLWLGPYSGTDPNYAATEGMHDGYYNGRTASYGVAYNAIFRFGATVVDKLFYNRSYSEISRTLNNKTMGALSPSIKFDYGYIWFPDDIEYGYSPYQSIHYAQCVPDEGFPPEIEFDYRAFTKNTSFYSYIHAITPFCDAESMLVRCESHQYGVYSGDTTGRYASTALSLLHRPKIFESGVMVGRGEHLQYTLYGMQQPSQSPTVITPPYPSGVVDEDTVLTSVSIVLGGGTSTTAVIPDMSDYHDITKPTVAVHYEVRSGVKEGDEAVVTAQSVEAQAGIDHTFSNPTVVGWV